MESQQRAPSPISFWDIPSQRPPVQRNPPPVVHRPIKDTAPSVRTGSSHGSSTIKASRSNLSFLRFGRPKVEKSLSGDGGSTVRTCPRLALAH